MGHVPGVASHQQGNVGQSLDRQGGFFGALEPIGILAEAQRLIKQANLREHIPAKQCRGDVPGKVFERIADETLLFASCCASHQLAMADDDAQAARHAQNGGHVLQISGRPFVVHVEECQQLAGRFANAAIARGGRSRVLLTEQPYIHRQRANRAAVRKAIGTCVEGRDPEAATLLVADRDAVRNPFYSGD